MIKTKMGNFPQARRSKQRWGAFHKRNDQNKDEEWLSAGEIIKNKDGELFTSEMIKTKMGNFPEMIKTKMENFSTSEMIKTKMGNYFPQETLLNTREGACLGLGLLNSMDLEICRCLVMDWADMVDRDRLFGEISWRRLQINQPNMKIVGKNYLSPKEIVTLQPITTVIKSNTQI